jgi:hypothetical protein
MSTDVDFESEENIMKKKFYFIELISTATPENKNFAGDVHRGVYGKGEELVAFEIVKDVSRNAYHLKEFDITNVECVIADYGFKSAKMAETLGKRIYGNNDVYNGVTTWTNEIHIIEREIDI